MISNDWMRDTDWRPSPCPKCGKLREASEFPICEDCDQPSRVAEVERELTLTQEAYDAAVEEVARLSTPPDDADVAALSAFRDWANKHAAIWKMGAIKMNGKFSRFMDPDTDTAWIGFKAGFLATHAARRNEETLANHGSK